MRCGAISWCLPRAEEKESPLLSNMFLTEDGTELLRNENIYGVLTMMRKRMRSQQLQAQAYQNEAEECREQARTAASKKDRILAEHHLELAFRADENYAAELAQTRNLALMVDTIDRALKDLELTNHFIHANATLGELLNQMPEDLEGLLDNIKDSMHSNGVVSKSLSKQLVRPKRAQLEDELDALMGPVLPEVVITTTTTPIVNTTPTPIHEKKAKKIQ